MILTSLKHLAERYRAQALMVIGVVVALAFLLAQVIDPLDDFLTSSGVLTYVTLVLVVDLSLLVVHNKSVDSAAVIYASQDASMAALLEAADSATGNSADLLEYAGVSTTPLFRRLRRQQVRMRILIRHPDECGRYQRRRTRTNLEALLGSVLDGYEDHVEVRCYRAAFTLRGRRIGDRFLEVGWLTHDFRRDTAFGQVNPSIAVDQLTADGAILKRLFDRTFQDLWDHDDTVSARTVIG